MISIRLDLSQFAEALERKKEALERAARPAAQAGAQVIYEQARLNVPVSKKGHYFHGSSFKTTGQKYYFEAGSLRSSIYQAFSEDNSTPSKATYHISWNRDKAPYAWMVEFGTSRAPAKPFMRPAIHDKQNEALQAMRARFIQEVNA